MNKEHSDRTDPFAAVKQVVEYTSKQIPEFEKRLETLNELSRQIDKERGRLRALIAAMKYPGPEFDILEEDSVPAGRSGKRMSRRQAVQRRAEAGAAIFRYMKTKPRDTQFSFSQLVEHFDRSISFMLPKILEEWNASHPSEQISHNGKPRAERRYNLK